MYSGALMSAKLRQAAMAAAGPALPHRSETLKPRRSQARRQWSIQAVKGKVTTRCLWNACKALTVGVLLILVGAAMATIGYYAEEEQLRLQALSDEEESGAEGPVVVDKIVPTHMFPLPPHYSPGRMAASNSSTVSSTTSTVSTIHSDNVADNDTASSRPKMGHIFTKDTGFGLNKLSYVGPIVMGFGGFVIVAACVMTFEARDSAAKIVPARFRKPYPERNGRDEESGVRHSACQTKWEALSVCHHSQQDGASIAGEDPNRSELSRRAMTFAFIQFSKTLQTSIDSSAEYYDGRRGSRPHLVKCPSAPSLVPPFHKSERRLVEPPRVLRVATRPTQPSTSPPRPTLAPNSLPRQAMSVDNPAVREVYAATAYPAFIGTRGEEEMELGASATGVHEAGSGSQASLALDLHLPQSCPVTLAIRDQSRSPSNPREEPPAQHLPGLKVDKQTSTSDHLTLSILGTSHDTWGSRDMTAPSSRVTSGGGSFRESRRPRPSRRVRRSETIDTASVASFSRRSHHQRHLSTASARSSSSRNGSGGAASGTGERRLQTSRSETARRHQFLRQHKVETGGSQEELPAPTHCHHPV